MCRNTHTPVQVQSCYVFGLKDQKKSFSNTEPSSTNHHYA